MFAIRAVNLTRGPLNVIPKGKSGGPTFKGVGQTLATMIRGGPKKGKDGKPVSLGPDLIHDISFEIEQGSITVMPGADMRAVDALMRMLASSLQPSSGRIEVNGTISGLIRVGDNLEEDHTAYEVVANEAKYLRVADESIPRFREEVLEFAGLKDFEDVQVRRFSSGMALRLGLTMMLLAKPSVVVMGEIMGVGDLDFRQRTAELIRQMANEGTTFLLGGPGFGMDGLADRRIYFERGEISADSALAGDDAEPEGPASHNWHVAEDQADNAVLAVDGIRVVEPTEAKPHITFRITLRAKAEAIKLRMLIDVMKDNVLVMRGVNPEIFEIAEPGWVQVAVSLPPVLAAIAYRVRIGCEVEHDGRMRTIRIANAIDAVPVNPMRPADVDAMPLLQPDFNWTIKPIEVETS